MQPIYYVCHPDGSYGVAKPQPTPSAQVPREPTEAMQRAMVDAMFDEGGDLKWRELAKIARKGWRAAYDTAMPAKVDGGAKERLGLWQVQGYTATDAAQLPSAPAACSMCDTSAKCAAEQRCLKGDA